MTRMSITLPDALATYLRAEAERLGISVADVIRMAVSAQKAAQEGKKK